VLAGSDDQAGSHAGSTSTHYACTGFLRVMRRQDERLLLSVRHHSERFAHKEAGTARKICHSHVWELLTVIMRCTPGRWISAASWGR